MWLDELIANEGRRGPRQELPLWEGIITNTVEAPEDNLFVAPADEPESEDGPARWAPRVEPDGRGGVLIRYPRRGDRAVVGETNEGRIWILNWWPS